MASTVSFGDRNYGIQARTVNGPVSIANLASTYRNQGRWEDAEMLFVQVMETRKTKLGADHPDTLTSMTSLAFTRKAQGRSA